jgi:hypothetical protein
MVYHKNFNQLGIIWVLKFAAFSEEAGEPYKKSVCIGALDVAWLIQKQLLWKTTLLKA